MEPAAPTGPADPRPADPNSAGDWADQVTEQIVKAVDNLRRVAVDPVRTATKAIIWGSLAIGFAVPALLIAAIGIFHLLVQLANALTPGPNDNAWMAWYALAGCFLTGGLILFARRNAPAQS